jgi:hypothetical protein
MNSGTALIGEFLSASQQHVIRENPGAELEEGGEPERAIELVGEIGERLATEKEKRRTITRGDQARVAREQTVEYRYGRGRCGIG